LCDCIPWYGRVKVGELYKYTGVDEGSFSETDFSKRVSGIIQAGENVNIQSKKVYNGDVELFEKATRITFLGYTIGFRKSKNDLVTKSPYSTERSNIGLGGSGALTFINRVILPASQSGPIVLKDTIDIPQGEYGLFKRNRKDDQSNENDIKVSVMDQIADINLKGDDGLGVSEMDQIADIKLKGDDGLGVSKMDQLADIKLKGDAGLGVSEMDQIADIKLKGDDGLGVSEMDQIADIKLKGDDGLGVSERGRIADIKLKGDDGLGVSEMDQIADIKLKGDDGLGVSERGQIADIKLKGDDGLGVSEMDQIADIKLKGDDGLGVSEMDQVADITVMDKGKVKTAKIQPLVVSDREGSDGSVDDTRLKSSLAASKLVVDVPELQYLIETNIDFIDTTKFLGSSYFLERIGFDSGKQIKLLGDSFYETRLVRDAVIESAGQRYLSDDIGSDYEQMQLFYDNAVTVMDDLGLTVGQELTDEQLKKLDKDIIWLVESEVDGEMVYAPQIYLSQSTRDQWAKNKQKGSLIKGDKVVMNVEESFENSGTIEAKDTVVVDAGKIINQRSAFGTGGSITAESLGLTALESIVNKGGLIRGGKYTSLQTMSQALSKFDESELDVLKLKSESLSKSDNDFVLTLYKKINEGMGEEQFNSDEIGLIKELLVGEDALISKLVSGGDIINEESGKILSGDYLKIGSTGKISNRGSKVQSDGDMDLTAIKKVEIISLKNQKEGLIWEDNLDENIQFASVSSGGIMRINGDEGVETTSAKIKMGKGGIIDSLNGKVVNKVLYFKTEKITDSYKGGRSIYKIQKRRIGKATTIDAGEYGLGIRSKGDIDLEGIKIKTKGNVSLESEMGDILLTGIKNSKYDETRQSWKTSSSWGLNKNTHTQVDIKGKETIDRTTIEAGHYSAKAGKGKSVIRQGTTIDSETIYEEGENNIEKTMVLKTWDVHDYQKKRSLLGMLETGSKHNNYKNNYKKNEVNENNAMGKIVKNFTGTVLLEGSKIKSTGGPVVIKGKKVLFKAVKDSEEKSTMEKESAISGISIPILSSVAARAIPGLPGLTETMYSNIDVDKGQMDLASISYKGTTDTTYSYDETARVVDIQGQGVQVIATDGKISGDGTKIDSGDGKLILKGSKGLAFTEAKEKHISRSSHSEDTFKMRYYVGNKWAESAVKSGKSIADGDVVEGAAGAGQQVQAIGDSAGTAGTFGFYVGAEITKTEDKTTNGSGSVIGKGSVFKSNGGMHILSEEGDMLFEGADITNTKNDIVFRVDRKSGRKIEFKAGETMYQSSNSQSNSTQRLNVETNILGHYSGDASHSQSSSSQGTTGKIVNKTRIKNSNGTIRYEGDTVEFSGAESIAKVQDVSKVNHLIVESEQDTEDRSDDSESINVSMGYSTGGGVRVSAGYSKSSGRGHKKWVNKDNVSKLVGTEDIVGDVESLRLTGGQVYVEGDGNKMSMTAKKVILTDIKDDDHYSNTGYNVTGGTGGRNKDELKKNRKIGGGISKEGHNKEQMTKNYLGDGVLKDMLSNGVAKKEGNGTLSETLENAQEITRDSDYNQSIDTRMVTDRMDQIEGIYGLKKTGQAINRIKDAGKDMNNSGTLDEYRDKTASNEALSQMTPKEVDALVNPEKHSDLEKTNAATKYSRIYSKHRGIDSTDSRLFDNKQLRNSIDDKGLDKKDMIAFTDGNKNKDTIYYEADEINKGDNFILSIGRENKRQDQIEKGIKNNTPDGISTKHDKASEKAGDHALSALRREMKYKKVTKEKGNRYIRTKRDKQLIADGSREADGVKDAQPYMPLYEFKAGGGKLMSEKEHYYEDLKKNKAPYTLEEARKIMTQMPDNKNLLHTWDGENTIKLVSKDGSEGIYNTDTGVKTNNPKNRGTYNRFSPSNPMHGDDIRLYIQYGTGPDDNTTFKERTNKSVEALINLVN
jgi:adhesin HecA-like repeat protein